MNSKPRGFTQGCNIRDSSIRTKKKKEEEKDVPYLVEEQDTGCGGPGLVEEVPDVGF